MNPAFFSSSRDSSRGADYDRGHSDRYHDDDRDRGYDRPHDRPRVSDAEFDEMMRKNRSVCDNSTERAIAAAGAGMFFLFVRFSVLKD